MRPRLFGIAYRMLGSAAEAEGDMFPRAADQLAGDVSGHGISAALAASRIYTETSAHLQTGAPLGDVLVSTGSGTNLEFCVTIASACHKATGDSVLTSTTGNLEMPRSKMKAAIMKIVVIGGSGLIRPRLDAEVCVNAPCGVRS